MKKFLLPTLLVFVSLFLFFSTTDAQESDCRKIFDQDLKKCTTDSNACQNACSEKTKKPDGTIYFNSGEIYTKCIRESQCDEERSACGDQALADLRACGKSGKKPAASEAKKETPKFIEFTEIVNKLSVETITVTFLDSKDPNKFRIEEDSDVPQDIKELFEKFKPMTNEEFQNYWNLRPNVPAGGKRVVDIGNQRKGYWWDIDAGAVINSSSWENIKFKEPVKNNNTQEVLRMVELDRGELEVKLRDPEPKNKFGVQGDFFDLFVIQTHFWVSQSQDKKSAIIAVYEGEVEVKTKDGKTIKVKPDGDKPGAVVVSRKLSISKLVLVGIVLLVIIGSLLLLLKRKAGKAFRSKK